LKPAEIRKLSGEEMLSKIGEMRKELFNLRFQAATGEIQNPLRIRAIKRDIARAKTIAKEMKDGKIDGKKDGIILVKNNA
jgi:large subunit ribosomal protein L29